MNTQNQGAERTEQEKPVQSVPAQSDEGKGYAQVPDIKTPRVYRQDTSVFEPLA